MLLCGADLVASFAVPGVWDDADVDGMMHLHTPSRSNELVVEILSKYGLVCLERNTTDLTGIVSENAILSRNAKNIHTFKDVQNDISSTKIRYIIELYTTSYLTSYFT